MGKQKPVPRQSQLHVKKLPCKLQTMHGKNDFWFSKAFFIFISRFFKKFLPTINLFIQNLFFQPVYRAEEPYKITLEVSCDGVRAPEQFGLASYSRPTSGANNNHYYFAVGGIENKPFLLFWM